MDLAAYLEPRDDNPPSGENLEYDPAFMDLELAAQPGEERQMGDTVVAAEEQDWGEVEKCALAVMEKSHDIRAAAFLAEAVLHTKGLPGFAATLDYVRQLLQENWESCHPELDEDDGDATMRINAVAGLASPDRMIPALRRCGLSDSRMFGKMTMRHIEVAEGVSSAPSDMDSPPDMAAVAAAFKDTDPEALEATTQAVSDALEAVEGIDTRFSERTPGEGPDLDPLSALLKSVQKALSRHAGAGEAPVEEAAGGDAAAGGGAAPAAGGAPMASGGGAINSPADVTNTLQRIMDYYARQEPSSPVPVLLERAKRLVGADFLAIIEDMAKEGLPEVHKIGGIENKDEYEY
ncbi:MAG: type VI secretion system protein TssA [Pseudomonadota bacterium]